MHINPGRPLTIQSGHGTVLGSTHPAYLTVCAGDVYEAVPRPNNNGLLIDDARHFGLATGLAAVGEGEEADRRQVFILASSQFLYPGVRLLGRFEGYATVGEGEDAETRPVYAIATCSGCLQAADYFRRADSADIGETWNEAAGDAAIDTNRLVTSDADARFWYWKDIPVVGSAPEHWTGDVTATLSADTAGVQASILAQRNNQLNPDMFVVISWEFGADDGKLLIRFFTDASTERTPNIYFANSGWDSTILFEGHGVAYPVTIRVCWSNVGWNVAVTRLDGRIWWARRAAGDGGIIAALPGGGHGLGTRDMPAGEASFLTYEAGFGVPIQFETPQGSHAVCPECQRCHGCPDDQVLCLRLSEGEAVVLERTGAIATGMASFYEHGWSGTCGWNGQGTYDGHDASFTAVLMLQTNGYWILRVAIADNDSGFPLEYLAQLFRVLGRDAPRCDEWACLELYESEEGGVVTVNWTPETQAGRDQSEVSVSSHADCAYSCYGVAPDPCPTVEELPATLNLHLDSPFDSGPFVAGGVDVELTLGYFGPGDPTSHGGTVIIEGEEGPVEHIIRTFCSPIFGPTKRILTISPPLDDLAWGFGPGTIFMEVLSDDPLHAYGETHPFNQAHPDSIYTAEITE